MLSKYSKKSSNLKMQSVLYNKDLFTNIMSYLDSNASKKIINAFRGLVHYEYIQPTTHLLLYGQVQSGKTSKIMEFVTKFKRDKLKILVIQNNTLMLSQYVKTLSQRGITYKVIDSSYNNNKKCDYNKEQVLITINNKFRLRALHSFIKYNKITNYSLILDESDQYLNRIQTQHVFKMSKDILHVTATPFIYIYGKKCEMDKIIKIKPQWNYVGMDQVKMNKVDLIENNSRNDIVMTIADIIRRDFLTANNGLMLVNCFAKIVDMKYLASILTAKYSKIPIIIFSTKTYIYLNGMLKETTKVKNIQKFTDELAKIPHAIFIAGRLSSRGINYTNTSYSRYITHQISVGNGNYTSFIQKCRIFGNRNITDAERPSLYCLIINPKQTQFVEKLMERFRTINSETLKTNIIQSSYFKKTLKQLKIICKENKITKYSKLKKNEIIELLERNQVSVVE